MKRKGCQVKSEAKTWDDLIEFTEAKIAEMQDSLKTFRRNKEAGRPLPGMQSSSQLQEQQHSV